MNKPNSAPRRGVVDDIAAHANGRDGKGLDAYVRTFYADLAEEDLLERDSAELCRAALGVWKFGARRAAGTVLARAYNPGSDEHGWQSPHTVVEIVNDDMPFLVDTVTMEINRQGYRVHLIIHPVIHVARDAEGRATGVGERGADGVVAESWMQVLIDRQTDAKALSELVSGLHRVLGDARVAVRDWAALRARMRAATEELAARPPAGLDPEALGEAVDFLAWLGEKHFTFLGYREYDLQVGDTADRLVATETPGLGILAHVEAGAASASFDALSPEARALARARVPLILTKSNSRATVHRPAYMDYVGVRRFGPDGEVIGEHRFLGLYTSAAYGAHAQDIPLVAGKIRRVAARFALVSGGHKGKALTDVLANHPREELFQVGEDELYDTVRGILHLAERQRVRLFARRDAYGRFFSCLVYVPRERYNTELRIRIQAILLEELSGSACEFTVRLTESPHARVHFIIHLAQGATPEYDLAHIEQRIAQAARSWRDDLADALVAELGEERGLDLLGRYGDAFPPGYRDDFLPRSAIADIDRMERLLAGSPLELHLYRPFDAPPGTLRFKVLQRGAGIPLSDALPVLENLGVRVLDERPYEVEPAGLESLWIADFSLSLKQDIDVDALRELFHELFAAVWQGRAENDGFNRLVLPARLTWREITVLRAYAKYMRQAGASFSEAYIAQATANHPDTARMLVELFLARFDPDLPDRGRAELLESSLETALEAVTSLDEDRILRQFLALILASLRTNYFQAEDDGSLKPYLSFKLDPSKVPDLPLPRPMFEIFVYSPRMEGVHLRGGKVARGGIRWSDRREDFRTEILGLMKAQMVKNAVIVPVGAKGGFVVKQPPAEREALMAEVVACYRTLIRGMLDLTGKLSSGTVSAPPRVVRYDGDDPYLVVAADKGTATFSDIANGISAEYGHWLGDAFASGGSNGYDHKKMGITARGAWESVKRHFRELGVNIQATPFTVAGIGDMSGDVFGNGMLLSRQIRLVAAFDHRHVFIDPDPDPETSFTERQRMFALPRSSWADYNPNLISKGGGIFPRSLKSISLSEEARRALGIKAEKLTPAELIRCILTAPVDLLFNGGIGTYVKASRESNADAGDRSNDPVRVNGKDLRCKVVGEGGNLGFTQRGRVEYALAGGRINTDAIDNAAGVNCSDHEVNIKILVDSVVAAGDMTAKQRNALLAEMTEDVARLVLRHNYLQTQSLSVSRARAPQMLDAQQRFMRALEREGRLNRAVELLPDDEEIAARRGAKQGLTTPEMAVLLAYAKIDVYDRLLASDLPDDPYFAAQLRDYFPRALVERFGPVMDKHRLKREIVATYVTNNMVNRVGITFAQRLMEETGASAAEVARAYTMARDVFGLPRLWEAIEALDNVAPDAAQTDMLMECGRLLLRATLWLLRHRARCCDTRASVERFAPAVQVLAPELPRLLPAAERDAAKALVKRFSQPGVPKDLAQDVGHMDPLFAALDLAEVAEETSFDVPAVAAAYFRIGGELNLPWLRAAIGRLPADNHWQALAKAAMRDELSDLQRVLAKVALKTGSGRAEARCRAWLDAARPRVERCVHVFGELEAAGKPDAAMLSVALREVRGLLA